MKKLKKIIVAIDVFAKVDDVLKRALIVAKENEAELFIVHAIDIPWISIADYFDSKEIVIDKKSIKKEIEKKLEVLNIDNVPYSIFVRKGDPDDVILYEAKLLKADMIVIGSHIKSKSRRNILGKTVQKVAHKSHLPVLIVKNSVKNPYKNILAPTDFERQSKQSVVFAKNIFPTSKIKIVHIYETFYETRPYVVKNISLMKYNQTVKAYAENNLKYFLKNVDIKDGEVLEAKEKTIDALVEYIKDAKYDLIVVGSRGISGFQALLGSVASFVAREIENDVLVYVPMD